MGMRITRNVIERKIERLNNALDENLEKYVLLVYRTEEDGTHAVDNNKDGNRCLMAGNTVKEAWLWLDGFQESLRLQNQSKRNL